jgi:O-antigen/teichoic acid export membrane protein
LYKAMLGFGLPMIVYEFGASILNLGDRFVVNAVLGSQALGEYAAAYNVCEYVQAIAIVSVTQAVVPMYTRIWHEQGPQATARFLERALHFYIVIAAALVAAMVAGGPDLLRIVASSKYGQGAPIIPWVVAGLVLDGATTILGAGLFAAKKTQTVMWSVVASAIFNIGLNFILVPWAGLVGAGVATLLSYALLCLFVARAGRHDLAVRIPWMALAKLGGLAALGFLGCAQLDWGGGLGGVLARLAAGTLAYVALAVAFDRPCHDLAAQAWRQLTLRLKSRGHAARPEASS